jgi:hypothetical protein
LTLDEPEKGESSHDIGYNVGWYLTVNFDDDDGYMYDSMASMLY